ncbi:MAG: hypothetical protein A2X82_18910 [Geobacteraceae bacterium GWC2_55_20]|nr:MAG: hypothetical protein A2X82_18910 [Geobacteraceae bacterium GWC2_55_20]OGU21222.1 MAG: hypothetical protein A2X85_02495 [Geobacteraceae bacterium GWF2_54_21]HBA73604.1 hypothetical protein [Geobacter sp.]HCE69190.1 hypothetical protein [Geobacter sp.]
MIWVTGDLHGGETASHITSSNFSGKQGDIVLCMGDLGGVWYHDYHTNEEHRRQEDYFLESRLRKRFLWMAVDGNHENFARLFGGGFPLLEIFGGRAYKIREHVYYMKRGEVFNIEGKTFLAFGGAMSRDKNPGMVPNAYGKMRPWPGRTEGVNWWPEEVPGPEDLENAYRNLDKVGWKVDYVLSHTCPESMRPYFGAEGRPADPTESMLQELLTRGLIYSDWHFGHYHLDMRVERFVCHYKRVRSLNA